MTDREQRPKDGQRVEILVGGEWLPATFCGADYVWDGEEEWWWMDFFQLDDHTTMPQDVQSDDPLPPWRPRP